MRMIHSVFKLMKMIVPVLTVSLFCLPLAARSEIKAGSVELSPFVGYNFFENRQNLENSPVFGGRIGYNITNTFAVEGTGEYIRSKVDNKSATFTREGQFTSPIDGVDITMYHLDLLYHFMPEGKLNPFVTAGYGAAIYSPKINNKNMSVIDFGIGAKYWVADNIALRFDLRDNMVYDDQINNIETTLGVVFAFGGTKKAATAIAASPRTSDTTAPKVIFTSPYNGATAVPVNQKANAAFSKDMDPATITSTTFVVKQGASPVPGNVPSTASTATFTPLDNFDKGTTYSAAITTGVRDLAGKALANNYVWGFTTGLAANTTAPTVIFTSPVNGASAAPVTQKINAAFSKVMDPSSITPTTFIVTQGASAVPGTVTSAASAATFTPAHNFDKGKTYTVVITKGARDLTGNTLANDYMWSFTAFSEVTCAVPVLATLEASHFKFDSAEISEDGKSVLDHNVMVLNDNPNMKIRIAGYASASGTEGYNQKLSERRAASVRDYLVNVGGINGNRLTTIGFGDKNPAKFESDPSNINSKAARANMRVVLEVIEE